MNDYDLIAPFYDMEHAHFDEDVNLYMNFAGLCGGPLLELACGSGRLLVPLAREGYELTGVDSSATMLDLAREALEQAGVRNHLTPGGRFILDISNADVRYMEHLSGQLLHQGTWQRDDSAMLSHFVSPASSPSRHLLELTHFYEEHRQGEAVKRTVIRTHLYLFERNEMELLLEEAGFVITDVYGDYELNPFEHDSPRMIFIAETRK